MKRLLAILLALTVLSGVALASGDPAGEDIIILFTSDVHCGIREDIGYAGLAAYVADCREQTPYVALVDCGDSLQGDVIGTVSQGAYIVDIMNQVGYDYAVLGNHEFDYGMEVLGRRLEEAEAVYLGANITYTGAGENALSALRPYALEAFGDTTVAFLGLTTPRSTTSSSPMSFMDETGAFVYDFAAGDGGEALYALVQGYVEECRAAGADYVVLLTHLGDGEESSPWSSVELIQNISGVDAVLDGHAHSTIPTRLVTDAAGEDVVLVASGEKLENIGRLVITPSGGVYGGLVSQVSREDEVTADYIQGIQALYEEQVNTVVAQSDMALSGYDEGGIRLVRSRETAIGNFCADAYRAASGADIAFVNGGGIRADLPAGDITYADLIALHPYGNTLCMVEATGQEILDALEMACRLTEGEYAAGDQAAGENGGFLQVSGLRFVLNTETESTVTVDEAGMFVAVTGARRVEDVEVLDEAAGAWVPLDPMGIYTLASHNYLLREGGDGMNMFGDNVFLLEEAMLDYEVLIRYLTEDLEGVLSQRYAGPEGRIALR